MKRLLVKWRKLLVICLLVIIYGCVSAQETRHQKSDIEPIKSQNEAEKAIPMSPAPAKPKVNSIYQQIIEPLTTRQCAQCHYSVFENIRDKGGKHQINCRECHAIFHTFRPGKAWADVVPQCSTCHDGVHGTAFSECLSCHTDPHAPVTSLINLDILSQNCGTCHAGQKREITQHTSAHTEVTCKECHHTEHGHRPKCTECHSEPHTEFVDNSGCMACHPAHSPREINYSAATGNQVCSGCHVEVTQYLTSSTRKHSTLQCVFCHANQHGFIPDCNKCHSAPHSKAMMNRFENNCSSCHGEPHSLTLSEQE